jgi:myo-inositol-1(or 4)-monophosphatase
MAVPSISEAELDEIHAFAVQLAKDAGQMLLDAVEARSGKNGKAAHLEKESAVDLVTQTDEGECMNVF